MRRPVIGHLFRSGNSIPVERAQDIAKIGEGRIKFVDETTIEGVDTKFLS